MAGLVLPLVAALLAWWLGTALVLWLCRLPESSQRWSLPAAGLVGVVALDGLVQTANSATPAGAYTAFACAVLLWGCLEVTYYTGWLTGPRERPCPPGCGDARRFRLALQTSLHHELAVVAAGGLVVLLASGGTNTVGLWTYMILWWMRWSAKLNLFLGVPNHYASFLPPRLQYLGSYMATRRMNLLFPISVCVPAAIVGVLLHHASGAGASAFEVAGAGLLAALLALAVLEHWFFVIPLPEFALWGWAVPRGEAKDR